MALLATNMLSLAYMHEANTMWPDPDWCYATIATEVCLMLSTLAGHVRIRYQQPCRPEALRRRPRPGRGLRRRASIHYYPECVFAAWYDDRFELDAIGLAPSCAVRERDAK
eukprot:358859-Chlamydomonas_euryale.AAC.19